MRRLFTFSVEQLDEIGTLVFGRVTYEGMADYWPTPEAERDVPEIAARMNGVDKLVVSRTLEAASWENTRLIRDNVVAELSALQAADRQGHRDLRQLGPDREPPACRSRRRAADHGQPDRAGRGALDLQVLGPPDPVESVGHPRLQLRQRPALLPAGGADTLKLVSDVIGAALTTPRTTMERRLEAISELRRRLDELAAT